jgi:WD40 repeat protein
MTTRELRMTDRRGAVIPRRFFCWSLPSLGLILASLLVAVWQESALPEAAVAELPARGDRAVASLAFFGDDGRLVLGWDDGWVSRWDPASGALLSVAQHQAPVLTVATAGDGAWIATAAADGKVCWWKWAEEVPPRQRSLPGAHLLRFSPDSALLGCATEDGQIRIWDVTEETEVAGFEALPSPILGMEWSPDGSRLAVLSWYMTQILHVAQLQEVARIDNGESVPLAAVFQADGQQVLLVDDREKVSLWDIAAGRRLQAVPGHRRVARAGFSPGARMLAVGNRHGGQIHIRDVLTTTGVLTLRHLGPRATAIAFAPDGRWLAAAGVDGSVRAWRFDSNVDDPDWRAAILHRAAVRSLPLTACFLLGLAGCCIAAAVDWRRGLALAFVLGLLRDPVRKLMFGSPVWVTAAVALVWIAVGIGFLLHDRQAWHRWWRCRPYLGLALVLTLLALVPGVVLSLISYPAGWQLVLLGGGWYGFAWLGLILGWSLPRWDRDVIRLLAVFCVVHGVGLLGCVPEAFGWNLAMLGGINADWYRSFTTGVIALISGPYRSPDVLGWHAAHVLMFAAVLLMRMERKEFRFTWVVCGRSMGSLAAILMAALALVLAGRRKMTMMPLLFFAALVIGGLRGAKRWAALSILAAAILVAWIPLQILQRSQQAPDVVKYVAWTSSDTVGRVASNVRGVAGTWRTAGFLGHGLGTATQGRHYLRAQGPRLWQEDGLCFLLAELGVYGILLLLAALVFLGLALGSAMARDGANRWWLRTPLASVVLANVACFAVSHQLYSGDPTVAATVGWCLGLALAPNRSPTVALEEPGEGQKNDATAIFGQDRYFL